MGKNEFLTPKAIANRIKAKGLQKLRWYCQMCQKQCRDENGFKCHCMSESHQRQMQVFGQNPTRIISGYSEEFESMFLEHMKRSHRFSRIAATVVYNEYIADRNHVHMNSTQWATLTEFIKYLGKTGKCKVEETPKGWFITYIDNDSETLFKEKMKNKRLRADMVEEEKMEREIQKQIERAEQMIGSEKGGEEEEGVVKSGMLEKNDEEGGAKIKLSLGQSKKNSEMNGKQRDAAKMVFDEVELESSKGKRRREGEGSSKNASVLDELMKEEEKAKERFNRKDYWLCPGIVVKVMSKALVDKGYYKQKGFVRKVIDKYCGEIEMLENKHVLRVDQEELETVLPQIGGLVKIVNGAYRGENARLLAIDTDKFCAKVQIEKGIYDGRVLKAVESNEVFSVAKLPTIDTLDYHHRIQVSESEHDNKGKSNLIPSVDIGPMDCFLYSVLAQLAMLRRGAARLLPHRRFLSTSEVPTVPAADDLFAAAWRRVAPNIDLPKTPLAFRHSRPSTTSAASKLTVSFVSRYSSSHFSNKEVDMVIAPGVGGEMGILPGHVASVSELKPGLLSIHEGDQVTKFFISSGFAYVHSNSVLEIIAVEAVEMENIDPASVLKGLNEYNQKLSTASTDAEKAEAQIGLDVLTALDSSLAE